MPVVAAEGAAMSDDYLVFWDDNFHFMDPDSRVFSSRHETADEAIEAAKRIVDEYLESARHQGMCAADLYSSYVAFGEDSFVVAPKGAPPVQFSAWDYAKERSKQMAAED